ncbi:MAG: hypothetical protein K8T26_19795 [Lentisphaerae bacterium]|nr:hypothetical protein [Lentisphaerota bacterium]
MKSYEFTLLKTCPHCGLNLSIAFARCQDRGCRKLRPEFEPHASVVTDRQGPCIWTGRPTDVCLPDGSGLWAPYFLDALRAGWLDNHYRFTDAFRAARSRRAGK